MISHLCTWFAFPWWLVTLNIFLYTIWSFVYVLWEISIKFLSIQFSSINSRVQLFATPAACQASLSITHCQELTPTHTIKSVMPYNHLILCHPLLLLPSIFSSIRIFSNESVLHIRQPENWSVSFSISPSNEYSGLISFKIDWFDLLAVQGTLKSLLQQYSSKAPIIPSSAFFMVQLSHPHTTSGKTIGLTTWGAVGKSNVSTF